METIRVSPDLWDGTSARLTLKRDFDGRIRTVLKIEDPISIFTEQGAYENVEQAELAARATAETRRAKILLIEDRT